LFLDQPSAELRQGDVCYVDKFPKWTLDATYLDLPNVDKQILAVDQMTRTAKDGDRHLVCVCSYDCELDNKTGRAGVLLAPIKPFPRTNSDESLQALRDCSRPIGFGSMSDEEALQALETSDEMAFANYNFYPMRLKLGDVDQDCVVDFASIASLSDTKTAIPHLISTKQREMNDTARKFFQLKISLFIARPPVDAD
jgi:hypothetical protein